MMARIAGIDPGKQKDSFAFVGTDIADGKIRVLGARRWQGKAYLEVEESIAGIHKIHPFKHYVVERNSVGEHVVEVLARNYRLPVVPVITMKDIKSKEKRRSPSVMDKNDMVKYMIIKKDEGNMLFPKETGEIKELLRQLSIFAEIKSPQTGNVRYQAEGAEHDDLVMALMLACFIGRYYINRKSEHPGGYAVASKSFKASFEKGDTLGSGIPYGSTPGARSVHYP